MTPTTHTVLGQQRLHLGQNGNMKHAPSSCMMGCDLNLRKNCFKREEGNQVLVTLISENILIPLHEKNTNACRLCEGE